MPGKKSYTSRASLWKKRGAPARGSSPAPRRCAHTRRRRARAYRRVAAENTAMLGARRPKANGGAARRPLAPPFAGFRIDSSGWSGKAPVQYSAVLRCVNGKKVNSAISPNHLPAISYGVSTQRWMDSAFARTDSLQRSYDAHKPGRAERHPRAAPPFRMHSAPCARTYRVVSFCRLWACRSCRGHAIV
jgi:hypothetical protein